MKGQIVGYVRVSSIDQNLARQLEQLKHTKRDASPAMLALSAFLLKGD